MNHTGMGGQETDSAGGRSRFRGRRYTIAAVVVALGIGAAVTVPRALAGNGGGGAPLSHAWSQPVYLGAAPNTVSCVSRTFCVEATAAGNAATWDGTSWSETGIEGNKTEVSGVSCSSTTFCVAVDGAGNALTWSGGSWSAPVAISGAGNLTSVSCASSPTFCIVVDAGGNAAAWDGSSWTAATNIDPPGGLSSVSCVSAAFCVAVDSSKDGSHGNAVSWDGTSWSAPTNIDPGGGGLAGVSCSSTTFCVAVDGNGNVVMRTGTSWSAPAAQAGWGPGGAVSCSSSLFCTAVDYRSQAITWNGTSWSTPVKADPNGNGLTSVSCISSTFCAAADFASNGLIYAIGATTTLSSSRNPSATGQSVTYTAKVVPASGSVGPTGTVAFSDGSGVIASCAAQQLTLGQATCVVQYANKGINAITATYSGDANYAGSSSKTLQQTVFSVVTKVSLSPVPNTPGATATYSIHFTTSGSGALGPGDAITVAAAPGTALPAASADYAVSDSGANTDTVSSVSVSNAGGSSTPNQVRIVLAASGITAGDAVTVGIQGVVNPAVKSTSDHAAVSTSADQSGAQSTAYSIGTSVSGITVSASPNTHGATATYTISFTTSSSGALGAGSTITLLAPAGTSLPATVGDYIVSDTAAGTETVGAVVLSQGSGSTTNNDARITLSASGISALDGVTVTVSATVNPPKASTAYHLWLLTSADANQTPSAAYTIS